MKIIHRGWVKEITICLPSGILGRRCRLFVFFSILIWWPIWAFLAYLPIKFKANEQPVIWGSWKEKCDESQLIHTYNDAQGLVVPPLEKRLKNPFLDDDPFEQLGAEKTRFSATKPHFQPLYLQNFKRMK